MEQESATPPFTSCLRPKICASNSRGGSAEPFVPNSVPFFPPSRSLPLFEVPQKAGFVASVYSYGSVYHRWRNTTKCNECVCGGGGGRRCMYVLVVFCFPPHFWNR